VIGIFSKPRLVSAATTTTAAAARLAALSRTPSDAKLHQSQAHARNTGAQLSESSLRSPGGGGKREAGRDYTTAPAVRIDDKL
jgi:hypothetical protein